MKVLKILIEHGADVNGRCKHSLENEVCVGLVESMCSDVMNGDDGRINLVGNTCERVDP